MFHFQPWVKCAQRAFWRAALLTAAFFFQGNALLGNCADDKAVPLNLAVTETSVLVTGGTPTGRILLLGYGRAWNAERYTLQFKRFRSLLHSDANGTFELQHTNTTDYIWAAIDLDSGRCGTATLGATELRQHPLPAKALRIKDGKLKKLDLDLPFAYLVIVRPQQGAWEESAADASATDDDLRHDGKISLTLGGLTAIGNSGPPPTQLETHDVLLVFSPQELSVAFARVEAK